jgi:hypothetical protein
MKLENYKTPIIITGKCLTLAKSHSNGVQGRVFKTIVGVVSMLKKLKAVDSLGFYGPRVNIDENEVMLNRIVDLD